MTDRHVELQVVQRGDINMKLIVNHVHGHVRMMDYRVGGYEAKRAELDAFVLERRLRKVFVLVEKQDSHAWRAVGFTREGVYPLFFRTADAHVMSRFYDEGGAPLAPVSPLKALADEQGCFPGRRLRRPDGLRLELIGDEQRRRSLLGRLDGALRAVPFGRVEAPDLVVQARARREQGWAVAEIDEAFGHATLGVAPSPAGEPALVLSAFACNTLLDTLGRREVCNLFGLSPAADGWSNALFAGLGFKVSGRLARHLRVNGELASALIWHRRLAAPS